MNSNFPFRVAFIVCSILLVLGYILLQVQLRLEEPLQVQVLPLKLPSVAEWNDPDETNSASFPAHTIPSSLKQSKLPIE